MAGRKVGLYFSWSRPREVSAKLDVLENRYPTLYEFRRDLWPRFEKLSDRAKFRQDISGFLDHVVLADFGMFRNAIQEHTGFAVRVMQREAEDSPRSLLNEDLLGDLDTLIIVSLDHICTGQIATDAEIEVMRSFLHKERNTLVVCPHHDIGCDGQIKIREIEHGHHGDRLVPAEQRIGGFARSLLSGLGFPIENQFGLNPAAESDGEPAPLRLYGDLDGADILKGVTRFNLHPHLPHLFVPSPIASKVRVLAQQAINPGAHQHPFVEAGNEEFNALLQITSDELAGRFYVCDATLWSSAFGGIDSLKAFWRNLAGLP